VGPGSERLRREKNQNEPRQAPHPANSMFAASRPCRLSTVDCRLSPMKSLRDLHLNGQRLLLRVDFNVPLSEGRVTDRTRIEETLPTVRLAMEAGAKVICASHLGKPKGKVRPELS